MTVWDFPDSLEDMTVSTLLSLQSLALEEAAMPGDPLQHCGKGPSAEDGPPADSQHPSRLMSGPL